MPALQDLTGRRYGRWVVVQRAETNTPAGLPRWVCRCDCGIVREVTGGKLRYGLSLSCGCWNREKSAARIRTTTRPHRREYVHGAARRGRWTPTYVSWASMKERCRNPRLKSYADYGSRGITVCPEWMSFERFLADMGERPPGMSLDRIDVNGNYEPGNCRWATRAEQRRNRR